MYHEEAIINGVLCHRGDPQGDWIPYTPEELTAYMVNMNEALREVSEITTRMCINESNKIKAIHADMFKC